MNYLKARKCFLKYLRRIILIKEQHEYYIWLCEEKDSNDNPNKYIEEGLNVKKVNMQICVIEIRTRSQKYKQLNITLLLDLIYDLYKDKKIKV